MTNEENDKNNLDHVLDQLRSGKLKLGVNYEYSNLEEKIHDRIQEQEHKNRQKYKQKTKLYKLAIVAAISVTTVCIFLLIYLMGVESTTIESKGKIEELALGTAVIHLNYDTKISINESSGVGKKVYLNDGEIFIENTKNELLEIITKEATVRIFNGKVNIFERDGYNKVSSVNSDAYVAYADSTTEIAGPGEELRARNGRRTKRTIEGPQNIGSFRSGFLYYEKERLDVVLADLERAYRIEIIYDSNFKSDGLCTGLFNLTVDPIEVLRKIIGDSYDVYPLSRTKLRISPRQSF